MGWGHVAPPREGIMEYELCKRGDCRWVSDEYDKLLDLAAAIVRAEHDDTHIADEAYENLHEYVRVYHPNWQE